MSLSFTVVTTPADRAAVELLAVPIGKEGRSVPVPLRSTPRWAVGSPRS